jgi:hypothetical protein
MKKKVKEQLMQTLDGLAMYFFTLMGVLISKYLPLFREGEKITFDISWAQFIMSLFVAFLLLTAAEQLGGSDSEGKRKRFLWRAVAALSYGTLWYNIIGG